MESLSRQDARKTIDFLIRRVRLTQRESKASENSQTRGKKSPDVCVKLRKKQPRQKNCKYRNESVEITNFSDLELDKTVYINSLPMFQESTIKPSENSLPMYSSISPKSKRNVKIEQKRKFSPYANVNKFFTLQERVSKPLPKMKNKPKPDFSNLQNYFLEFQAKSKFLLKQLEKNVLG